MVRQDYKLKAFFQNSTTAATVLPLDKGAVLIDEDALINAVYVVKSGLYKCVHVDEQGREFVQEFFGEGALIGELEVILEDTNKRSIVTITALTAGTVYVLTVADFKKLMTTQAVFNSLLLQALARKVRYKADRHAYHQTHSLRENIQYLQRHYAEYWNQISKRDIANYLGITIRSLNRELNHRDGEVNL